MEVLLIVLGTLLAWMLPPIGIGAWILLPLDRAARHRRAPLHFSVLDLLGLLVLLQIPLGLIHGLLGAERSDVVWVLDAIVVGLVALVWFLGVATFSRAGIERTSHRAWLVLLVLPTAYCGSFAVCILPFVALFGEQLGLATRMIMLLVETVLVALVVLSAQLTRRFVFMAAQQAAGNTHRQDSWTDQTPAGDTDADHQSLPKQE